MNIFFLDNDIKLSTQFHVDKHIVKLIVELGQMLSTTHKVLDGIKTTINNRTYFILEDERNDLLYKSCYINHPCNIWLRESTENYNYTYNLFCELCNEYSYRFDKKHLTDIKLRELLKTLPKKLENKNFTFPALAMPDEYKSDDYVLSYRKYYIGEKKHIFSWKKREIPHWIKGV